MMNSKNEELIDQSENEIEEHGKRQKVIEIHEIDGKNLKLICDDYHANKDQPKNYSVKRYKVKINEKDGPSLRLRLKKHLLKFYEWIIKIDKIINHSFEKVYLKIPGYIFGIFGIFILLSSTYIALILYLCMNPNYSIFHNWISDLGIGPNGANIIFNTGWILSSGFILLFNIHEIRTLKTKVIESKILSVMILSNIAFSLGIFLIGIYPENLLINHIIGASFYFIGGFIFYSYYGLIALFNKKVPITHTFMSFITSLCFTLFFISLNFPDLLSETGITITSAEWLTFFAEISMMFLILKESLVENYYSRINDNENEYLIYQRINKFKLGIEFSRYTPDMIK